MGAQQSLQGPAAHSPQPHGEVLPDGADSHADTITLTGLHVYPVKSCRGIVAQEAICTPNGLAFDREWMVVADDGCASACKFLTQRQVPQMALIETSIEPRELLLGADPAAHPDAALVLRTPSQPSELRVLLASKPADKQVLLEATCWDWSGRAQDEGDVAAAWLSAALGRPVRLVRFVGHLGGEGDPEADPLRRTCDTEWSPPNTEMRFQDGYPVLMASEASLADLNSRLGSKGPLPINRFRPNLVVSGPAAWAEDRWVELEMQVGSLRFVNCKPCDRCSVPRTNQATALVDAAEPTETLYTFRSGKALGWEMPKSFKHAVFFGVNLLPSTNGRLAVGDTLRVLQWREGPYVARQAA